mgnify:CR=1 FL=1
MIDSYKVYDVIPNKAQIRNLMNWEHQVGVDFWLKGGIEQPSRIMVSPEIGDSFISFLNSNSIDYELTFGDVEATLKSDEIARSNLRDKRSVVSDVSTLADGFDFGRFWKLDQMETYTIQLALQYPNIVKRDVIGKSIEGRDIFGLRLSTGSEFGKKPIIFIDAGTHAREWVGPQAVLYLVDQLVTNATVRDELLEKVDWVVVPNVNPDGEKFSS